MNLVTLDQAKAHLRVSGSECDDEILDKISQASAIVLDYLKIPLPEEASPSESPSLYMIDLWPYGTPQNILAAVLLTLGELWEHREANDVNVLSPAVCALLARRRDPAMA